MGKPEKCGKLGLTASRGGAMIGCTAPNGRTRDCDREVNGMAEARLDRRGETRALLMRWGGTMEDIRRLERERDALRQWAEDARCTLRGRRMDGLLRGGEARDLVDVVEAAMQRAQMYVEQSKRIDGEIAERLRLRNEVEGLVRRLPPVQERVLVSRYVERHPWRSIALRLNYDEGHVRRIETQAVDWIGEQMNA